MRMQNEVMDRVNVHVDYNDVTVREELPNIRVRFQGKVQVARLSGRALPFAQMYVGNVRVGELPWSTAAAAANSGNVIDCD